ncbi:MAG: hypothetical protein ACKA38_00550 [Candidatus Karelsulcia muelleri]|uniref:hypothetical protein n=1 Tax=Candidatus Karelsulcia muelleri TaxID=336810 RepID=UPI000D7BB4E7|nr:hypothetical protein [Candidatus Karelsulcia muelleri]
MIDENLKEEFKKLKIKGIEENNNADFENYKKRLKIKNANKTLELLHIKMKHKKGDIFNIRKLVT